MISCFKCGREMIETRITGVGELPPKGLNPISIYYAHPKSADCNIVDYVIQIGYRA